MAWNPTPEVAVARAAAAKLTTVIGSPVDRVVVLFTTADGKCGSASYGETVAKCREAKTIGDLAYAAAFGDGT